MGADFWRYEDALDFLYYQNDIGNPNDYKNIFIVTENDVTFWRVS
jgi:hypothetical protein